MGLFETLVLAVLQGITEFLPISSSAHLILPSKILGWDDQGLAFDVAVHFGTLIAVVWYFRSEISRMIVGWLSTGFTATPNADAKLSWMVAIATVPAVLVGLVFNDLIEMHLRTVEVIAATTIGFGILLGLSDRFKPFRSGLTEMTIILALIIGVAQALALIPGTSRSGITMSAALLVGFSRLDAARFSFLLSVPLILAASGLKTFELLQVRDAVDWEALGIGMAVSGISAWLGIHYFLALVDRIGMLPFVIYRLLLGAMLFFFFV